MFVFFADCTDVDQARAKFKSLCKIHHPDVGGSAETFREMVREFQAFQKAAWDQGGASKWGAEYKPKADSHDLGEKSHAILAEVVRFPDIQTEILGTWIWCSGETRKYKDQFKGLGMRWSKNKSAWFYHEQPYRKRGKRSFSLDEIRGMHGQTQYDQKPDEAVA